MIRLATRLTAGGGREALVRLLLTGVGIALAVTMLLFAAVSFPALRAHDERRGWTETGFMPENAELADETTTATEGVLWRLTEARYDGRDVRRVDVAALGPDAPVPPGLERLPAAGELAVSPALRELLETTDPSLLGDRLPGEVTATVGRDALASPEDLLVFVGRSVEELRTEPDVQIVQRIRTEPISHNLTRVMRLAFVVGGVGLLAPVVVFVATATRLAAARREQRLAAMRLAGATHRQIGIVAAVEAAIAAVGGTVVGFGVFFALRPSVARIPVDGASFYTSDLHLSPPAALFVGLAVPALAVGAALVSLRRLAISPLGVARQSRAKRATPVPLLLVALGMGMLLLVQATMQGAGDALTATAVGGGFLVMMLGIVLSGPWLTSVVGRAVGRLGRRAPSLLAARRLQDNPAAGFRSISGIILAVFVSTVFSTFAASILANQRVNLEGMRSDVVAAALSPRPVGEPPDDRGERVGQTAFEEEFAWPDLGSEHTARAVQDVGAVDGVRQVVTAHAMPDDAAVRDALARSDVGFDPGMVLMRCDDVAALGFDGCDGTTAVGMGNDGVNPTDIPLTELVPVDALADLPVIGIAAITDGQTSTIEQARTRLEQGLPGAVGRTQADIDAENLSSVRSTQRISNFALAVTLVIAGCSLAVAVAGSIVERRQPFTLLRLAGTRLSELRRAVLAEAAAPLLMVALASAVLGVAVTAISLESDSAAPPLRLPAPSYWMALVGGIGVALLVVLATMPLLSRLTSLDSTRFE